MDQDADRPTACWDREMGFQPIVTYPEPGWMERTSAECMMEWVPSGAYEEDWRLQPGSDRFAVALRRTDGDRLYKLLITGNHAMYSRSRQHRPRRRIHLQELVREYQGDRGMLLRLLDTEYSYAERINGDDEYSIQLATHPFREGDILDLSWIKNANLETATSKDTALDQEWQIESWWELA